MENQSAEQMINALTIFREYRTPLYRLLRDVKSIPTQCCHRQYGEHGSTEESDAAWKSAKDLVERYNDMTWLNEETFQLGSKSQETETCQSRWARLQRENRESNPSQGRTAILSEMEVMAERLGALTHSFAATDVSKPPAEAYATLKAEQEKGCGQTLNEMESACRSWRDFDVRMKVLELWVQGTKEQKNKFDPPKP